MERYFNTTGLCNPEQHYMVPPFRGLYDEVYRLVETKQYFLIHAPRQTGKTTFLHEFAHKLNREGKYACVVFSVKNAGAWDEIDEKLCEVLNEAARNLLPNKLLPARSEIAINFGDYVSDWVATAPLPVVLLIDDVDALSPQSLGYFLSQLREGFTARPKRFPGTIVLAGKYDFQGYLKHVKTGNPFPEQVVPFNVVAGAFFLPFFSRAEVRGLLDQHTADTGQVFSDEVFEQIFYYSGGQPWLTNALANEIVAGILKDDPSREITPDMVEAAKETLIAQRQTHLDSLVDKFNEPRVRRVIMRIINGESPIFDDYNDAIRYCRDLGIVTQTSPVQFSNPIYREIITRILNHAFHDGFDQDIVQTAWYLDAGGRLDIDKLLAAFVTFYRRHSESWLERFEYKEAGHQLLLMAFLQRIVNGGGRIEREMAIGNGRTDLAIFWKEQVIPIELKLNHDNYTHAEGLQQLGRYMDKLGQGRGHLVIFEKKSSEELPWEQRISREVQQVEGREIAVWTM